MALLVAADGFLLLDTSTTPELEAEGLARDMIRGIQDTRKAAGFDVSDRITLTLTFDDDADAARGPGVRRRGRGIRDPRRGVVLASPNRRLIERGRA